MVSKKLLAGGGIVVVAVLFLVLSGGGGEDPLADEEFSEIQAPTYVGDEVGQLHKISGNGSQDWVNDDFGDYLAGVAVDGSGNVVAATRTQNEVRMMDPNGDELWSYTGLEQWPNDVTVDDSGVVYTASDDQEVHRVSDGSQDWVYGEFVAKVTAVTTDGEYVYAGTNNNEVHKIDAEDGTQEWVYSQHTNGIQGLAVQDGTVYSVAFDGMHQITSDGEQGWSFDTGLLDVAVQGDRLYAGGADTLYRLNPSNGQPYWQYTQVNGDAQTVGVDAEGYAYTGTSSQVIHKVDPLGEQVWTYEEHRGAPVDLAVGPE